VKTSITRIKNSTILNLVFGVAFMLLALVVIVTATSIMRRQALVEAEEKARILQDRNLATHRYFSEVLKPRVFAWTAPFRPAGYFDPSWMSSSYAVRRIQQNFNDLNATDYSMKDAVANARNPGNEADAEERAFLAEVNANPDLVTRTYIRSFQGVPNLVFLRRGEVLEATCLACHGAPADAPAELVSLYGPVRGFGRQAELGSVISAISIRIPLADAYAKVSRFSMQLSGVMLALLAAFFLAHYLLNRRLLYSPIAMLRDKALEISGDETRLGEQVPLPFGRELGELASAFNAMSVKLRNDRDHLEERIRERGADLVSTNERLERDIEERRHIEALLQRTLDENRALLRELQHRAKNSFAMIDGLITLVADEKTSKETKEALGELELRVRSISELYSLLYSSETFAEVRLDDYCERVVEAMRGLSNTVLIETDLEAVIVPVKTAAPIGLIVTELITNSLKHAFPEGGKGRITLSLRREEAGARLELRDDGVGLPTPAVTSESGGSGLALIESLAAQIKADFSLSSAGGGTLFTLGFKVNIQSN
jgi:two-component sensor histidine kinase